MGRPRQYGARRELFLRVVPELHDRLVAEAHARDVPVSLLVTWSIEQQLLVWESDPFVHPHAETPLPPDNVRHLRPQAAL